MVDLAVEGQIRIRAKTDRRPVLDPVRRNQDPAPEERRTDLGGHWGRSSHSKKAKPRLLGFWVAKRYAPIQKTDIAGQKAFDQGIESRLGFLTS